MRLTRVHTDQPLTPGSRVILEPGPSRHLSQVLRLGPGAACTLFNGDGHAYLARLETVEGDRVSARLESLTTREPPPALELHLLLGISKGERMDLALQKAVELGVTRITPINAQRSLIHLRGARLERRLAHWRGILVAACEQSGRCRLPGLDTPMELGHALAAGAPTTDLNLVLDPQATLSLRQLPPPRCGVAFLIGPEGGLEDAEIRLAESRGFRGLRLGPRILRTETAPLAALAAAQALWGDF